ncbi:D-alanine--D-alanine ligase [Streptomyces tendae]
MPKSDESAKVRIGIVFGGSSEEHAVSVKRAEEVARNLDTEKYQPFYVGITRDGAWKLCDGPGPDWEDGDCRPAVLSPDRSAHGLLAPDRRRLRSAWTSSCPADGSEGSGEQGPQLLPDAAAVRAATGRGTVAWSTCRTPGRRCRPGGPGCPPSGSCSRGGCGGRWPVWRPAWSPSPWR